VALVFVTYGLALASWMSRTPAIRDILDLSSAQLGLMLLGMSCGSLAALPTAGPIVQRLGTRGAVLGAASVAVLGLTTLGIGLLAAAVPVALAGLVLIGIGLGVWDVGMNVEGAQVERALRRPLMPRLHAGFSVGVVAGAALGAASASVGLPVPVQVLAVAVLVLASVAIATRHF
jgi:fucose permease